MNLPPLAWVILALGLIWLVLRVLNRRAEDKRAEARELRMAELLAERERLAAKRDAAPAQTCLGCKTVNAPGAVLCAGCGLEL